MVHQYYNVSQSVFLRYTPIKGVIECAKLIQKVDSWISNNGERRK